VRTMAGAVLSSRLLTGHEPDGNRAGSRVALQQERGVPNKRTECCPFGGSRGGKQIIKKTNYREIPSP
jgi:hypothetical protein